MTELIGWSEPGAMLGRRTDERRRPDWSI